MDGRLPRSPASLSDAACADAGQLPLADCDVSGTGTRARGGSPPAKRHASAGLLEPAAAHCPGADLDALFDGQASANAGSAAIGARREAGRNVVDVGSGRPDLPRGVRSGNDLPSRRSSEARQGVRNVHRNPGNRISADVARAAMAKGRAGRSTALRARAGIRIVGTGAAGHTHRSASGDRVHASRSDHPARESGRTLAGGRQRTMGGARGTRGGACQRSQLHRRYTHAAARRLCRKERRSRSECRVFVYQHPRRPRRAHPDVEPPGRLSRDGAISRQARTRVEYSVGPR